MGLVIVWRNSSLRNTMKNFNVSFGLRAFIIYFVILGSLAWYIVNNAIERLNDGMRQSAESVMVDMSHLLASEVEKQLDTSDTSTIDIMAIEQLFNRIKNRAIQAKIYQISKNTLDTDVYVTDKKGFVIYDSTNQNTGKDFSKWRDVRLTLEGEYGARTSFIDPEKTEDNDEKIMVVAAPIRSLKNQIIGSLSVVKSINSLEGHLETESNQLKNYALLLVMLAIFFGFIVSIWMTKSLEKISHYAQNLSQGITAIQPRFWDDRLDKLSSSVTTLRNQLDGKEYVENYIHSLTHELKTPITSIRGAAELLLEEIPQQEREKFIKNIHSSNNRMAQLVEKMLSLAKLESQMEPLDIVDFDLTKILLHLQEERQSLIDSKSIQIDTPNEPYRVRGDRILIRQAVANLLDNAIAFCPSSGLIQIQTATKGSNKYSINVFNQGTHIPDFALPRIYERFFSMPAEHNPLLSTAKSTGLGLSFVQEIMKLHQGSVSITNTVINHAQQEKLTGVEAILTWASMS